MFGTVKFDVYQDKYIISSFIINTQNLCKHIAKEYDKYKKTYIFTT